LPSCQCHRRSGVPRVASSHARQFARSRA
jgi:hypothetical protein